MTAPSPVTLASLVSLADQLAAGLHSLGAVTAIPPATPAAVQITAVPTSAGVLVSWTTTRNDITGWTVSRDGVDTSGSGPWSTPTLPPATRAQLFTSLVPGSRYQFTLVPHLAGLADLAVVSATASLAGQATPPLNPPVPGPPVVTEGTQAAVLQGWGKVLDGDEFETAGAPSSANWGMYDGPGHNGNGVRTPKAYAVSSGILSCTGDTAGNTGGMAFKRGSRFCRVEVRQRLLNTSADTAGAQYHPVLLMWPDSDRWPSGGEIDFAETDIGASTMGAFIHHPTQTGVVQDPYQSLALDITQWHNYAVEWGPSGLTGWIDGRQFFHDTDPTAQPPGPMHLCIQLDNFGGTPHQPARQDVAWVRIYAAPTK